MSLRACILGLSLMAATVVADAEVVDSTTLSCTIVQSGKGNGTNTNHRGHGPQVNKNQNQDATKLGKALYFMTNSDENGIISLPIQDDGKVTGGSTTRTQEKGIVSIDGSTKKPAERDGLVSQSSVHVVDNYLFAVNSGSNNVMMFSIDKNTPTKLTYVGNPVKVDGDFPNTVTASKKHRMVCVGMTGAKAGVQCAPFTRKTGIGKFDALRTFNLKQANPPVGPANTVSQVFFSDDEKHLFVTVKGNPDEKNKTTGFLDAFEVQHYKRRRDLNARKTRIKYVTKVSDKEVKSEINDTKVLFGAVPIPGTSDILATDASFGAAILSTDDSGKGSLKTKINIDKQNATCWATISPVTKTAFVTDINSPRIVELNTTDGKVLGEIDVSKTGVKGMIDLQASGKFLYALAPGQDKNASQIIVVDVSEGSKKANVIQNFDLGIVNSGNTVQGMAILRG